MESIRELLLEQMGDLYDAEKQLVAALPTLAKNASNDQLRTAFENHLEQTRGHVSRLEQAFELLGQKAKSKPCEAMKGLIKEGKQTLEEDLPDQLMDSAVILAAQKVEHYEIAGYGTISAWAHNLGWDEVAGLLETTLEEEKEADQKLTEVAATVFDGLGEAQGNEEKGSSTPDKGAARKHAAKSTKGNEGMKRRAN
jgi:ferritin-like metal-binding protein YciE